jgi:para-nitrobenzyl esterase
MRNILRHLALAAGLCLASASYAAQPGPVVDAPAGSVEGTSQGAQNVFKGIPYAQAPTGTLRWKAPVPLPRWQGTKSATAFGPACFQPVAKTVSVYTSDVGPMGEDCLFLNVWAPKDAHNAPVMVWIHGGALLTGSGSEALYDGTKFAARGIIVVSINYRLGVLGWLAHPELSALSPLHISGNYGLLDQIQALHWVHDNISAFGGDPAQVTIAGESAGGLSVMYLMAAPGAKGLFARAIAESAYMISTPELRRKKYGGIPQEDLGVWLQGKLNAPSLAAMRAMDGAAITNAAAATGYPPFGTIDGQVLPRQLVDTFDGGNQAPVPMLAGFNSGEIRSLRMLAPPVPASAADYEKTIHERYLDLADQYLKLYPSSDMPESILAATRDGIYGWTAERLAFTQTRFGLPSYLYYFDHAVPATDAAGLHGFHASELPYVFGTLDRTPPHWPKAPSTPAEAKLSDAMTDYWASFVRSGHPEAAGEPAWQPYGTNASYMAFKDTPVASDHLLPGMYALNEEVVCRRRANGNIAWNWNLGLASPPLPAKAGCGMQ